MSRRLSTGRPSKHRRADRWSVPGASPRIARGPRSARTAGFTWSLPARTAAARSRRVKSLGRTCLLLGRLDEAPRLADRAIESSPRQPGFAAHALHLLGDIATHRDRFDAERGEVQYRQALALAEPRGMRPLVAHCHFGLGKLYRRTGKRQEAHEHLTTATTMYREMEMRFWLGQAYAEMREMA